jgi:20S proteasome alpha/beta subunit
MTNKARSSAGFFSLDARYETFHTASCCRKQAERKDVTIIAGFRCKDGIVVCADTQETTGAAKRDVPKLRFEARGLATDEPLAIAICGSGYGPLIDKLVDEAWTTVQPLSEMNEVCEAIETTIKKLYQEYGRIYQRGHCPAAELIYGVQTAEELKLFSANGPIINERPEYYSSGQGYYLADFIASRMYVPYLSLHQCVILAAYVLFQAKEHVDGCGGDSHIAILRNDGMSGVIDVQRTDYLTKMLESADPYVGSLLLSVADLGITDDQLVESFARKAKVIKWDRKRIREELEQYDDMTALFIQGPGEEKPQLDSFGLLPLHKKAEKEPQ